MKELRWIHRHGEVEQQKAETLHPLLPARAGHGRKKGRFPRVKWEYHESGLSSQPESGSLGFNGK